MQRLFGIYNKNPRLIIGLMSGTSYDGVDAALVKIANSGLDTKAKLLCHYYAGYPSLLRDKISSLSEGRVSDICRMNFEIGEFFAKTALECIRSAGLKITSVDAVASHGQTVYHCPPELNRKGSTLQIGESAVIARRTGLPVVSDFRTADMARNGHGAPLVPYVDYMLFCKKNKVRAVQNIGGIANVTVVTPEIDDLFAFDTGPGNCLINTAMTMLFKKPYDKDGLTARSGRPDDTVLKELLAHPYFAKKPPKSTGRELFGKNMVKNIILKKRMRPEDLISTLTHFTARSIKSAYERHILKKHPVHEIIFSGGGTKNRFLMELLRDSFKRLALNTMDDYGIPACAKEAMSFAILANETLSGNPSNLPNVTGASGKAILGKITLP